MPSVNVEFNADASNLNAAIASVRVNMANMAESTKSALLNAQSVANVVALKIANAMEAAAKAVASAVTDAMATAWTQAARFEDASVRLAPFVGGLKNARDVCESLRREAANGVMSFEDLAGVAGKLSTVFSNTSDVKKWTSAFHDLAAGTGINVETLVEQFVKSKAGGTVSTNFLDVFARKGVNIFAVLAQNIGTTENAIKEMAKNGEISLAQLEGALTALTSAGGQFAGMAKKMSSTAQGSLNSLKANFDIVLAKLAEPVAEAITPALQRIAAMFGNVAPLAGKLGSGAVSAMKGVVAATEKVIEILAQASEIVAVVAGAFVGVQKGVEIATAVVSNFGVIVATAKAAAISAISAIAKGFVIVATRIKAATTAMTTFIAANKGASIAAGAAIAYEGVSFILDRYVEQNRSASERLDRMYAQLNEAQTEFFSAKSPEALDKAYAKVTAAIERLRTEGAKLHAELGTQSGFNFDALSKIRADEYAERRGGIAEEARAAEAEAARIEAINRFLDFRQKSQEQIDNITASNKTISDQREDILGGVHEDDLASVSASIDELRNKFGGLSKQEYDRALDLIDAKQKLLELDQASAQTKDAYHQKIILLQAELEGTEALAAAKEKLHKAELEKQGIDAGFSNDDARAVAQATIELEKQVEAKKAADALAEYNKDTEIIAAEN
ncbi:MAG: tape measure protein, partial [Prevotellaceae bacterium]|nr:tape measure protein [Prevotellaceae bacterium]